MQGVPDLLLMLGPTKTCKRTCYEEYLGGCVRSWYPQRGQKPHPRNVLHVVVSIAPRRRQHMPFLESGTTTTQGTKPIPTIIPVV